MNSLLAQSHRIFSIALVEFGLIATDSFLTHPASNIALLLATGIGASLPDIDQHNSKVSRKSPLNVSMFLRHRGITHSLLGWIIFAVILYFLMNLLIPLKPIQLSPFVLPNIWGSLWLGLVIGYFLHLVEDSFSKQGVQWLAPFYKKKGRPLLYYKVGGPFEKFLAMIAYIAVIIMTVYWVWLMICPMPRA